jgi:hypothetical protein
MSSDLFEEVGLGHLSDEAKNQVMEKLLGSIQNRVLIRVIDDLPEADQAELEKLLETDPTPEQISTFLAQKNIDMNSLIVQESFTLKADLMAMAEQIKHTQN